MMRERWLLVHLGAIIALLLAAYTLAKVIREALFITTFGAPALPFGYIGVAAASAFFVWFDPLLIRRLKRSVAGLVAQLLAIGASAAAAIVYAPESRWLSAAFYLWTGSQLMMLIPHFWLLVLDQWDSRRARTIFPVLTGCGLAGGVAGGAFAHFADARVGVTGLLWTVTALLLAVTVLNQLLAGRRPLRGGSSAPAGGSRTEIVLRSPFLRYLVLGLTLAVVVSTLIDFQFKVMAQRAFPDLAALTRFLGVFYAGLNGFALLAQFTAAGWFLRQVGIGPAVVIQPVSALAFSLLSLLAPLWGVVLALRWAQGVVFQTLGKSATEIYSMAVRPPDRRSVQAAIDVVTERGADAFVGVVLVILVHIAGVNLRFLATLTAVLAVAWMMIHFRVHREYTRAFRDSLSGRWIGPEDAVESLRSAAARRALDDALRSADERQVLVALQFCRDARYRRAAPVVRSLLKHPSPRVQAAAIQVMRELAIEDRDGIIPGLLTAEDDSLRCSAAEHLCLMAADPSAFARTLLDGGDPVLRDFILELLVARPAIGRRAMTLPWARRRLAAEHAAERAAGALALGLVDAPEAFDLLRQLVHDPEPEVQRAALRAAPLFAMAGELATEILPLLAAPGLREAASEALAAAGDLVVPALAAIAGAGDTVTAAAAARTLARISSPAAHGALVRLARQDDRTLRYLGLRNLNRLRVARGEPVLDREIAHRLFLRELRDYRTSRARALALHDEPERILRLLSESYTESADRALERACRALACWYEPEPLAGVYRGLRVGRHEASSRALEYLEDILPRRVFHFVRRLFELPEPELAAGAPEDPAARRAALVRDAIERAWEGGDAWLRACALRAAQVVTPAIDVDRLLSASGTGIRASSGSTADPLVTAELERLASMPRSA